MSRSAEPDWYGFMESQLKQVREAQEEHDCPVLIPGDLFDDGWRAGKCPPELVNFALRHLPRWVFAIPGQHDLPHHRYEDVRKSAFWTLVEASVIEHLPPGTSCVVSMDDIVLEVTGFPWGTPIVPADGIAAEKIVRVCLAHKYVWDVEANAHPGASEDDRLHRVRKDLDGYDCVFYGDNHRGFFKEYGPKAGGYPQTIVNCGTFLRRKSDEKGYAPKMYLVHADKSVTPKPLDTSMERWADVPEELAAVAGTLDLDPEAVAEMFRELGGTALNFMEAVRHFVRANKPSEGARAKLRFYTDGDK